MFYSADLPSGTEQDNIIVVLQRCKHDTQGLFMLLFCSVPVNKKHSQRQNIHSY